MGGGSITELRATVARVAAAFDASVLSGEQAAAALGELAAVASMVSAMQALAAARVEQTRAWRRGGHRDAAAFVARTAGVSRNHAREVVAAGARLGALPGVASAARAGALSGPQRAASTAAAAADPAAEGSLVALAGRSSLGELREACRRTRRAADADPDATHRRLHQARRLRRYGDGEGAYNLCLRTTPEAGAVIDGALAPLIEEAFAAARAEGRREAHEAYAADALVALCRRAGEPGPSPGRRRGRSRRDPRYLALLRVDLEALRRGRPVPGEECEIAGVGPVPVSVARELLGEAIVELVLTRGSDVVSVTHLGRGPSAAQRIALLWSQPLCQVAGCGRRARLEADHGVPWATNPETRLENLRMLCEHHHDLKTREGWDLVAGNGPRPLVAPDDPRHPRHAEGRRRAAEWLDGERADDEGRPPPPPDDERPPPDDEGPGPPGTGPP
jgi:hypothetical protein